MIHVRTLGVAALVASLGVTSACLSEPDFDTSAEPTSTASGSADMALVGPTTIAGGTLQPTSNGKGKGSGDCKGKGCDDKGDDSKSGKDDPKPQDGGGSPPADTASGGGEVLVPSFWIDLREVSASDFGGCVRAGACTPPGSASGCTLAAGLGDHPVNCVSRTQAAAYCKWRNKRLVRQDEWAAAATGASSRAFPWGAEAPSANRVNACGSECAAKGMYPASDGFVATAPTASFPSGRSPEGVFDLAGNVAEWVEGEPSAVRGGSFAETDVASLGPTAARAVPRDASDPTIGFRCARNSK